MCVGSVPALVHCGSLRHVAGLDLLHIWSRRPAQVSDGDASPGALQPPVIAFPRAHVRLTS
jgi:hypothetical protein